jgi:multisubunit Na+/H+ antiporter MnhF subunit
MNPASPHHLPVFITSPGHTDVLLVLMGLVLIGAVLGIGIFFFWLHSLPERMVHHKLQFDIVAVLCLLSLLTHEHAYWVVALLLSLVKFPDVSVLDFLGPLKRIASSLEAIANAQSEMTAPSQSTKPLDGSEKGV